MSRRVYIRPLILDDARISYKWRNNPLIWKYTGSKPNQYITVEIELEWLKNRLRALDERRFAICLIENDQYIGNIQLTNITSEDAQYHIFIGEPEMWGKGIAKEATLLILDIAFMELKLSKVWLEVYMNNIAAITVYKKVGFREEMEMVDGTIKMAITKDYKSKAYVEDN